jgi:hypothetical protein
MHDRLVPSGQGANAAARLDLIRLRTYQRRDEARRERLGSATVPQAGSESKSNTGAQPNEASPLGTLHCEHTIFDATAEG